MNVPNKEEIRLFILHLHSDKLTAKGLQPNAVPDDYDLLEQGLIDSMGVLELVSALEERFKIRIDLETIDTNQLTIIGPFSEHVSTHSQSEQPT
jgi:acyl carrier protein